ncbi:MAG: hypothetical protein JWR44_1393, partial [Hymenobacter sp.]|nr:hypothetical protein [Hymenobacter sp.]
LDTIDDAVMAQHEAASPLSNAELQQLNVLLDKLRTVE